MSAKMNASKLKLFWSSKTNIFTRIAIVLLFAHFVLMMPQRINLPEVLVFYFTNLDYLDIQLLWYLVGVFTWFAAGVAVGLTVFGRKNLGFLVAMVAFVLHVVELISFEIDFVEMFSNLQDFNPIGIAWLVSSLLVFPVATVMLVIGRPEVQRKLKKGS
jgi:hypothetical protein